MIKKLFATTAVAVSAALLLSGCVTSTSRTDNVITLNQTFEFDSLANWDESSLKELQKEGWTITEQQEQALRDENIAIPQGFYAINEDSSCFVSYNVFVTNVMKPSASEDYITREEAYKYVDGNTPLSFTEGTTNIRIDGSSDKLEMINVDFSYENKVGKELTQEEAAALQAQAESTGVYPEPEYTVDGEIYEAYISRTTKNLVANPFYAIAQKSNVEIPVEIQKEGNMVIEMKYACKKTPIDKKLWEKLLADATINFDPLPEVTKE